MKSREIRSFFRDFKNPKKSLCRALTFLGLINLFFLPFIHFHPENIHSHPGESETHSHAGHFHSPELENIAHWASSHPEDIETDGPLHHSHPSEDHDGDQIEYTTLALQTFDKNQLLPKTSATILNNRFPEKFYFNSFTIYPDLFHAVARPIPVRQVRGPPHA